MMKVFSHEQLSNADLIVDAVYEGGSSGSVSDDPISKLLPGTGNQGGFRPVGRGEDKKYVVLYTSGEDKDWPDRIDLNTGQFIYFGDNKTPGHELHDTRRRGNDLLRRVFALLHASPPVRANIPPFLIFTKYPTVRSTRSVQFRGLAAPGFPGLPATEDLVAVWKTSDGQRFQNYRSVFCVLDASVVHRSWLDVLSSGTAVLHDAPEAWREFSEQGRYIALVSTPTVLYRTPAQQAPQTQLEAQVLSGVFGYFSEEPFLFEAFAARVFQMQDQRVIIDEITRKAVDGGRDAVGRYLLGLPGDPVYVDFALEAKCYAPPVAGMRANPVGVAQVSRLISRIRHRQFGVLVTTSTIAPQAYWEVRQDGHPIVFISGRDIAETLIAHGYNTPELVLAFLQAEFPKPQ